MVTLIKGRTTMDLSGVWKYRIDENNMGLKDRYYEDDLKGSQWKDIKIPTNWYLTEIGDYDGAVWFQTSFRIAEDLKGKHLTLKFNAVDYFADVWLNRKYLGQHEGYFTPFEFNVTDFINFDKENILVVKVDSPRDPTEYVLVEDSGNLSLPLSTPYKQHWAKDLTLIKGHHIDAMHRPGAMTKYRQDGNSGGIWQPVEIIATGKIKIHNVKIYPKIVKRKGKPDGTALVSIDVDMLNYTNEMIETEVNLQIRPDNFESSEFFARVKDIQLQPGINTIKLVKTIRNPKLWWCNGEGEPNLYVAEITVGTSDIFDSNKTRFGIKEVTQDDKGNWYLNGRKLFLRGMRYLSSLWISEMDKERYREDLEKIVELNINSIRIGSHVEMDSFYELCDEMGLMVWQVFPMHYCYSDSDALIEKAAPMMKQMVKMLYNHACIGMWSVFKEPEVYALPDAPNNYGRLCEIMYEAARTVDPIRWVHKGDYNEGVQNFMPGYCQPGDTDVKKVKMMPNVVEFGCGALPCIETMKEFMPTKDLWPPNWDIWEYYCNFYRITFGASKIRMGNSLEEFIDNSQTYAAINTKEQAEFIRRMKYEPVGSMYLYFWNDPFPGIGSGCFDYYRRPYKTYDIFKTIYTSVLVSLEWNRDPYIMGWQKIYQPGETFVGTLWITNDLHRVVKNTSLSWKLTDTNSSEEVIRGHKTLTLSEDSSSIVDRIIWDIPKSVKGKFRVDMKVDDESGTRLSTNYFEFIVQ